MLPTYSRLRADVNIKKTMILVKAKAYSLNYSRVLIKKPRQSIDSDLLARLKLETYLDRLGSPCISRAIQSLVQVCNLVGA